MTEQRETQVWYDSRGNAKWEYKVQQRVGMLRDGAHASLTAKNNSLTVREKQTQSWAKRASTGNKENKDLARKKKAPYKFECNMEFE